MTKETLIQEIHKLSINERLYVLEQALKEIRLEKEKGLSLAAEQLYNNYQTDPSLTEFTALDNEPFYETK